MAVQQDCSPPYSYRPTFTASEVDCTSPGFEEHRSRGWAGGTFFRSKLLISGDPDFQGEACNLISIQCDLTVPAPTPTSAATYVVTVRYDGAIVDTYVILQTDDPNATESTCTGIASLRSQVGPSEYTSMPDRGTDIADVGGEDPDCLSAFSAVTLTGGSGGPLDSSAVSAIRSGPTRTTIIIQTTEDDDGFPIDPPITKKVQQWDGFDWIPYIPNSDCHPI